MVYVESAVDAGAVTRSVGRYTERGGDPARWPFHGQWRGPPPESRFRTPILFVLLTGISWVDLPQQLGYGSGMTCWRRLRDWRLAGVWDELHALLLAELHAADQIDWSRAAVDGSHVRAKRGRTQSDQARSTAPVPAASTTCSPTATASRSRSR
jgi:transposase